MGGAASSASKSTVETMPGDPVNDETAGRGPLPGSAPTYFALNLRSELPSYVALNQRYNEPHPSNLDETDGGGRRSSKGRAAGCWVLQSLFLSPIVLILCGVVLLPSAVYFIPREYFNLPNINETTNRSTLEDSSNDESCPQGMTDSCRLLCEELQLDDGVGGFSAYRVAVMAAAALSCASALCFLVLSFVKREKL